MEIVVHKYGGSSLATLEDMEFVAAKIARAHHAEEKIVVVVSAMGNETDRLLALAKGADRNCGGRELDTILASGEQVSAAILATILLKNRVNAVSFSGRQAGIVTENRHNRARIKSIDCSAIKACLHAGKVVIASGFQGTNEAGEITTLGRGGSDTTAVALAVVLQARECRIYTDVDGVYTTDPRIEAKARRLSQITFEEMLEMASLGAKVLQNRAVRFAGEYNVPLRVLATFGTGEGTLIVQKEEDLEKARIVGIAANQDEAQLTVTRVKDQPGVAAKILEAIAAQDIEVDMIVQNVGISSQLADFTFTVHRRDYAQAMSCLKDMAKELGAGSVFGDDDIVKISLVGAGMRSHAGIAAKMFAAIAKTGINIKMISTSEIKISVVVETQHMKTVVRTLHEAFDLAG